MKHSHSVSRDRRWMCAVALLAAALGLPHVGYAQPGGPQEPFPPGTAADVGENWQVSVETTMVYPGPLTDGQTQGLPLLVANLRVQNLDSTPRLFPSFRLRVRTGSGSLQRDTWCGRNPDALELKQAILPGATETGAACWTLESEEVSNLVLYLEPPLHDGSARPAYFALNPVVATVPRPGPSPAPLAGGLTASGAPGAAMPDALLPPALEPVPERAGRLAAPLLQSSPTPTPSARCVSAYSQYPDQSGAYLAAGCAGHIGALSSVAPPSSARQPIALGSPGPASGAAPCQLYPSANQPPRQLTTLATPIPQITNGNGQVLPNYAPTVAYGMLC